MASGKIFNFLNRHFYRICAALGIVLQCAILYSIQDLATSRDVRRVQNQLSDCGSQYNPCYITSLGRMNVNMDEVKISNIRDLCSSRRGECIIKIEGKTEIEAPIGGMPVRVLPR